MWKMFRRFWRKILPVFILDLVCVLVRMGIYMMFFTSAMRAIVSQGVPNQDMEFVKRMVIQMVIANVAMMLFTMAYNYFSTVFSVKFTSLIRRDCYQKVLKMSPQDVTAFGSASLLTRTLEDNINLQLFVIYLSGNSLLVPVCIVMFSVSIAKTSLSIFSILFLFFASVIFVFLFFSKKAQKYFLGQQKENDQLNLMYRQTLAGSRTIRAFANEDLEEKKLLKHNRTVYEHAYGALRVVGFVAPLALFIMNMCVVVIYYFGAGKLGAGTITIGEVLVIFTYLSSFVSSMNVFPILVQTYPKARVSAARVNQLLDYINTFSDKPGARTEGITDGKVELQKVVFTFGGDREVIEYVSCNFAPHEVNAVVGSTGSAKTILVSLIPGFLRPQEGRVLIDGIDVNDFDSAYLASRVSYAPQRPYVLEDTIRNNITMNREMSDDKIREVCRIAGFQEVLDGLEQGLNTRMSLNGMNLSGGQRQRLSLARALAKEADIYIFDDSFSALDAKTEQAVLRNILDYLRGKTVILVAQKISTVKYASNIITLDDGIFFGSGTHDSLMAGCEVYRDLFEMQEKSADQLSLEV